MRNTIILIYIIAISTTSCTITEKTLVGTFTSDYSKKSYIEINSDHTFNYAQNDPDPNTLISELESFHNFRTQGKWVMDSNNDLKLSSTHDSLKLGAIKINKLPIESEYSAFVFFDVYNDTIPIMYVQFPNGTALMKFHGAMSNSRIDLRENNTLLFGLFGYKPWIFNTENPANYKFEISMVPEFKPSYFNEYIYRVKRNKLIDTKNHIVYKRDKNGM